jgi:hypothetical protein
MTDVQVSNSYFLTFNITARKSLSEIGWSFPQQQEARRQKDQQWC